MEKLSVKESLSFGWATFKKRPWIFVGSFAIGVMIQLVTNGIENMVPEGAGILGFVAFVVSLAITLLFTLGMLSFLLKAHEDVQSVSIKDLWHPQHYLRFLGTSALLWIVIFLGLILLIVPGIIASLVFAFATYAVADRGLGPVEAFKESARITKGNRGKLFLLSLAMIGINVLGFLALIIGLAVTVPVTALAFAHAYRTLESRASAITPVEAAGAAA